MEGSASDTTDRILGVNLAGRNLRFANMSGAFLVKADLTGADLTGAQLKSADLQHAKLTRAILEGSDLSETNLRHATFLFANLRGVGFLDPSAPEPVGMPRRVNRSGFSGGSFWGSTDVSYTDFTAADLTGANLEGWFFNGEDAEPKFEGSNLYSVSNPGLFLELAFHGGAVCMESKLAWSDIAHGVVQIPEVPAGTNLEAQCHVSNLRPKSAGLKRSR